MKLPLMGDVKNKNVAIGGGVVLGIVFLAYRRKKKQIPVTAPDGTTSNVDPNAIDPNTGVPYGQEAGSAGGYYTNASIPNAYVSQSGTPTVGSTGAYTSNSAWFNDALQDAQQNFGATYFLATTALGKYLDKDPKGLNDNEYTVVSEVVALIGQPPVNGPYPLVHAASTPSPAPSPTPEPDNTQPPQGPVAPPAQSDGIPAGYHMQAPQFAVLPIGTSLRTYARYHYPIDTTTHFDRLVQLNPGINPDDPQHSGVTSIRTSDAHLVPNI